MVCEIKLWWGVFLLLVFSCIQENWVHGDPQVPCFFIFGDSMADNGNNNDLKTSAKVNYAPYGIDFPDGQTGRFCNGRNTVDFLAEYLGFDHHIPSFASANGSIILQGVNYASGSAGIRDETGQHLGKCMSLNRQLENHQVTIARVARILGNQVSAVQLLNKCLYYVGMGSNDYLNNYFISEHYTTSKVHSVEEYAKALISQYSLQLRTLYNYGARKFSLVGLGPIGCSPHAIDSYGTKGSICAENLNQAGQFFNIELKALVDQLNKDLPNAQFIYINVYGMQEGDPTRLGFNVTTTRCCKVRADGQCIPNQIPCSNRNEYVFWDSFHPTEAMNKLSAARIYSAFAPSDSYPFDIRRLALLDLEGSKKFHAKSSVILN